MAKPKRRQQRSGTSTANSVVKRPIQNTGASRNGVTPTATRTSAGKARSTSPSVRVARSATSSMATRQRNRAPRGQRRYQSKRAWWSVSMPILLSIAGVLVIVGVFIWIARSQTTTSSSAIVTHSIAPASVVNAVEHPDSAIFAEVGAGTATANLFKALPNKSGTGLPPENGKPILFYAGGEYCPFCAADRWSLIMALSRFGSFSGIEMNASSTSDIYPGTPTFTFVNASYTSPYLIFDAKEIRGAS